MQEKNQLNPLVRGKTLTKIAVSDKPPALGGTVTYLSPDEIREKFGFTYTESLFGNLEEIEAYYGNEELRMMLEKNPDAPELAKVFERLDNPLDCFLIAKMGSEASEDEDVGYGLFATKDIPAGTVLFLYNGVVSAAKTSDDPDNYQLAWVSPRQFPAESIRCDIARPKCVSNKDQGNLSRFMQHLPTDLVKERALAKQQLMKSHPHVPEHIMDAVIAKIYSSASEPQLEQIPFKNKKDREQVATKNVEIAPIMIHGNPLKIASIFTY